MGKVQEKKLDDHPIFIWIYEVTKLDRTRKAKMRKLRNFENYQTNYSKVG